MIQELKKELAGLQITAQSLRNFGLLFSGFFAAWAGALIWKAGPHWPWPAAAAMAMLLTGLISPKALRLPYRLWMLLAFTLGWFTTRLILTALYYGIMTPVKLLIRLAGKDLLDERLEKDSASYWKKHETDSDRERYKKQF